MSGDLYIGTSGYSYPHWSNGLFYPPKLPQKRWLEYYATIFNSVELNISFYRLPNKNIFSGWKMRTPDEFIFAAKGSRYITHVRQLEDCGDSIDLFFEQASGLENKLGVVLWQLPPSMQQDPGRLHEFCSTLKKNSYAASTRQAFEFRHPSWFGSKTYDLLKNFNCGLCIAHSRRWPVVKLTTADFVYVRFHGGEVLYGSNYSDNELMGWAADVGNWLKEGKNVYAYFNNDAYGYAVQNAIRLRELILEGKGVKRKGKNR